MASVAGEASRKAMCLTNDNSKVCLFTTAHAGDVETPNLDTAGYLGQAGRGGGGGHWRL